MSVYPGPRQITVVLICLGLTATFGYHAGYGRYGFVRRQALLERAEVLDFELKSLDAARARLQRDVALLAPDWPQPDIVEDIARETLGFAFPAERIYAVEPANSRERAGGS